MRKLYNDLDPFLYNNSDPSWFQYQLAICEDLSTALPNSPALMIRANIVTKFAERIRTSS